MIEATMPYPDALVQSLTAGPDTAEITVSLIAGPDRETTEHTINSFLTCCLDVARAGRFLVLDTGLPAPDDHAIVDFASFRYVRRGRVKLAVANSMRVLDDGLPKSRARPAIMRHDPGLAASPPLRYRLKVEGQYEPA